MQFTPQQMAGYQGYSSGVLIGNWSEDIQVREDKLQRFQHMKESGTNPAAAMAQRVPLSPAAGDGFLHFEDVIQVAAAFEGGAAVMAVDTTPKLRPKMNTALVTASTAPGVTARTAWVVRKCQDANNARFDGGGKQASIVHYGQNLRLVNEYCSGDGFYSLTSERHSATAQSRAGKQIVAACLGATNNCNFIIEHAAADGADPLKFEGLPVPHDAMVVLRHALTNAPLFLDSKSKVATVGGGEAEVCAYLDKRQSTRVSRPLIDTNYWLFKLAPPGTKYTKFVAAGGVSALQKVKAKILERGGANGFRGLVKTLRLMDDDNSRGLNRREFKDGMETYGVFLTTLELDSVFSAFDRNGDGVVSIAEFLRTLRGSMAPRRAALVREAFKCIDKDGSGVATFAELGGAYGKALAQHPAILKGTKTEAQVMADFTAAWDKNGDAQVTAAEFLDYYDDISVSIDNDDYFELMIRNAWHLSGGEGAAQNTSCTRVLVVFNDDSQEVVELTNDLGLDTDDRQAVLAKLAAQGVTNIKRVDLAM
jgi:Ca2+-binding EF-hand superfamily protein